MAVDREFAPEWELNQEFGIWTTGRDFGEDAEVTSRELGETGETGETGPEPPNLDSSPNFEPVPPICSLRCEP